MDYDAAEKLCRTASTMFYILPDESRKQLPFPGDHSCVCFALLIHDLTIYTAVAKCGAYLAFSEHWESEKDLLLKQVHRKIMDKLLKQQGLKIDITC